MRHNKSRAKLSVESATLPEQVDKIDANKLTHGADAWRAVMVFSRIAAAWRLTDKQAANLLGCDLSEYRRGVKLPLSTHLTDCQIYRLSYVFGIYKALQMMLSDKAIANAWPTAPNDAPLFGGRPPIKIMCSCDLSDLAAVRGYLDDFVSCPLVPAGGIE